MAWAKNGTPHTLTGTADQMDITDITANKFNTILVGGIGTGDSRLATRVGVSSADSGANYSETNNENGTENSGANRTYFYHLYNGYNLQFTVMYAMNVSGYEKLFIAETSQANGAGAGSSQTRTDAVGKWVTTSGQWAKLQMINYGSGDLLTGSNLSALGSDLTPQIITPAVPFAENAQVGSRAEITDTRKMYHRDDVDFKEENGNEATNYRSASWYEQLSGETP